MAKIVISKANPLSIATPGPGKVAIFLDENDNLIKYKDEFGTLNTVPATGFAVDEVVIVDTIASFPPIGSVNTLYLARIAGIMYYWDAVSTTYQIVSGAADKNFTFVQGVAASVWNVAHNLGKIPAVTVIDSAGTEVEGEVNVIDNNNCQLIFSAPFTGTASFN
jgi:hypothetical protein